MSPELVLVCPQLRLKALDALPDRPWEAFLPLRSNDRPAAPAATGSISVGSAAPLPSDKPVALATVDAIPADSAMAPVDDRSDPSTSSVTRRRGRDASLVMVGLVVGFIAAQVVPHSSRPSLAESPAASPAYEGRPSSSALAPSNLAVARGGYIFGRSGRFQIAPDLRTVRMFQARVKCARLVLIRAMLLHGGSRFGYRGQIPADTSTPVQVEVAGRFLDPGRVRVFVRARSRGCDSGKVRFIARLS